MDPMKLFVVFQALGLGTVNQLDIGHRRLVSGAIATLENANVTTRTLLVTGTQFVK